MKIHENPSTSENIIENVRNIFLFFFFSFFFRSTRAESSLRARARAGPAPSPEPSALYASAASRFFAKSKKRP